MWECCATLRTSPSPCGSPRTPSTGWSTPRGWARTAPAWPSTSSRRFLSFPINIEPKIHLPPGLDHLHPSLALVQHDVHGRGGGDGVLQHCCRPAPPQACHQPGSYSGWSDKLNSSYHKTHEQWTLHRTRITLLVLGTRLPCSMSIPKPGENPYQWLQRQVHLSRFYIIQWSARIQRANRCLFELKTYWREREKRNEYMPIQNISLLSILHLVFLSFLALLFEYILQTHFLLQDETCKSKTQVWSERIKNSITIRFPWSGGASDRDGARYKEALISGYNTSYDLVGRKS